MLEMQVAKDIIEVPFFEGLDTENQFDETFNFENLLEVKENDILIDSPFKQIGSRSKETIFKFIKLLDILIDINDSSLDATLTNEMINRKFLSSVFHFIIWNILVFNHFRFK